MSWEQLQLMQTEARRNRALLVLDISQAIVAGWGSQDAWVEKQKALIAEITEGLK